MAKKDKDHAPAETPPASPPGEIPVPVLEGSGAGATIPLSTPPDPAAEPVKRKRGRPAGSKSTPAAPAQPAVSPEDMERATLALSTTFHAVASLVSSRRGQHWEMSKEECETMGKAWAAALAPYLPKIGAAVPWVSALVITWTVVGPRVETDIRVAREREMSKKAGEGGKLEVVS